MTNTLIISDGRDWELPAEYALGLMTDTLIVSEGHLVLLLIFYADGLVYLL